MVKFVFTHSKPKEQAFFALNFKIQGGLGSLSPSDAHACTVQAYVKKIVHFKFSIYYFCNAFLMNHNASIVESCKRDRSFVATSPWLPAVLLPQKWTAVSKNNNYKFFVELRWPYLETKNIQTF